MKYLHQYNNFEIALFEFPYITTPEVSYISYTSIDAICQRVQQNWIAIQNGLTANIIVIDVQSHEIVKVYQTLSQLVMQQKARLGALVECFLGIMDRQIFISSFAQLTFTFRNTKPTNAMYMTLPSVEQFLHQQQQYSDLEKAKVFYALTMGEVSAEERNKWRPALRATAASHSRVLAALAAEVLTVWGEVMTPIQFILSRDRIAFSSYQDNNIDDAFLLEKKRESQAVPASRFEDRINVTAYNYFELVHPSYARQSVALVNNVIKYNHRNVKSHCLDIGTGPGTALLMQQELLPAYQFTALEPSAAAYRYLAANIKPYPHINSMSIDFLQFTSNQQFDVLLSTGASHHLNTFAFLQKAADLLTPNGIFVVADEMISPYQTITQRKLSVMQHHSVYILELLSRLTNLGENIDQTFDPKEQELCRLLSTYMPLAFVYAKLAYVNEAEYIFKTLLSEIDNLNLSTEVSLPNVAFYRLMHLELEALVAGIDYEVEQKTYPTMFMQLCESANLECIHHERIHNTAGRGTSTTSSGTHIFVLKHAHHARN